MYLRSIIASKEEGIAKECVAKISRSASVTINILDLITLPHLACLSGVHVPVIQQANHEMRF